MSASNQYYLRIQESEANELPQCLKERMTFIDNSQYNESELYKAARSKYVKAKRELEVVKFNLRHAKK
tara:strand:- start:96 stop:299 length:204 start_codon:yes stop_codon:yes gene_type:complete